VAVRALLQRHVQRHGNRLRETFAGDPLVAPARVLSRSSVWDALSSCESGGNWSANTGNGYQGGLQFLPQTWRTHGGAAFAPSADLATRAQQIAVAQQVLASQGWAAWPACSAMLGLAAASP